LNVKIIICYAVLYPPLACATVRLLNKLYAKCLFLSCAGCIGTPRMFPTRFLVMDHAHAAVTVKFNLTCRIQFGRSGSAMYRITSTAGRVVVEDTAPNWVVDISVKQCQTSRPAALARLCYKAGCRPSLPYPASSWPGRATGVRAAPAGYNRTLGRSSKVNCSDKFLRRA
jgi:hypothetical protein